MKQTWFITGAARGIGFEIAKAALNAGHNVIATGRNKETLEKKYADAKEGLLCLELDVKNEQQANQVVKHANEYFGRIDVVVNNAGFGQLGYFETVDSEAISQQFATNVFGLMNVTRAVLPTLRQQRSGHILNISSIGGLLGFEGSAIYSSTKFAIEGFSESLSHEVAPFGIKLTIIEPGFFRTDFLDQSSVRYGSIALTDYADVNSKQRTQYDNYSHEQLGNPKKLANLILKVADSENPPLRIVAGSDAVQMYRNLLIDRNKELETWEALSTTTDHTST